MEQRMVYRCSVCKEETSIGFFNHTNRFICRECDYRGHSLLFSSYEIVEGEVVEISPFSHAKNQRDRFVDYAYTLFGNKVSGQFFAQLARYETKYTYLGMARALEYFYIVKKNKVSGTGLGIIPYIYAEAQEFYEANDRYRKKNYIANMHKMEEAKTTTKIEVELPSATKPTSRFQLDLEGGD